VIGGNGAQNGLLVWDVYDKPGQPVLDPQTELPSQRPATVVAYNPRHNLIASAEREVCLWLPDPE